MFLLFWNVNKSRSSKLARAGSNSGNYALSSSLPSISHPTISPSLRYSARNTTPSNRPPTGIDLALGLNGFQRLTFDKPARTPTTLAGNGDETHDPRPGRLVSSAGPRSKWEEAAKWERIEAEVNERKARDEEERKEAARQAQERRLEEESQELREEKSRQLDQVVARDWRYQLDLKQKREEQERLREFQDAHDLRRKIQEEQQMELARLKQREREMEEIKRWVKKQKQQSLSPRQRNLLMMLMRPDDYDFAAGRI